MNQGVAIPRRTWVAFLLLSATFFMLLVDFSIVTIALPSMERELRMDAAQGQWIISTYAIFLAGFLMLTGRCADLFGRFRFFVAGLVLFTAASFAGGLAHSSTMLIAMRALQGLGAALVNPAALAIVLDMFPSGAARSRAIALWGTIGSVGIAAGMLFGGVLVQYLGWRSVLFVNVPVAIAILALCAAFVPRDRPNPHRASLDVAGAILLTATLVMLVYTMEIVPSVGFASPEVWVRLAIAILLFVVFFFVERGAREPILPPHLLRYPDMISGALVVMLQPMSYGMVIVFGSIYLQRVAGYTPLLAGLAFIPSSLVTSFVASPLTTRIAHALGVRPMAVLMSAVMIAGELIMLLILPHTSFWTVFLPATCIAAFGGMLTYQAGMIAGLAHVEDADDGSASAVTSLALQLGIGFSVAIGAVVQELQSGALARAGAPLATALEGGLHATFVTAVIIGVVTLIAAAIGIRHGATAEVPLRAHLPFGRLVHRAAVKA